MAKKSTKNLSELLKRYNINNDVNQYGFGSFLKNNVGDLIKTGVGAGLTATGVAAPIGIGMMAQGAAGIAGNELGPDGQPLANTLNMAGQVGGMVAGQPAAGGVPTGATQLARGGKLTEYNEGGTHEENPNGGIDIGSKAQVEEKETRWQDYIFSDRINIPGKKYSFSEASKKINNKYNKRENDSFDKKALDREMKALMSLQEGERERMDLEHKTKMKESFGDGGNLEINPLTNKEILEAPGRLSPDRMESIVPTSLDTWEDIKTTENNEVLVPEDVSKEFKEKEDYVNNVRDKILASKKLSLDNIPSDLSIDQNELLANKVLSKKELNEYLNALDWKNKYYSKIGREPINYAGEDELGQGTNAPLAEQRIGPKHLGARRTDYNRRARIAADRLAYGGKVKAQYGLDLMSEIDNEPMQLEGNPMGYMPENDTSTFDPYGINNINKYINSPDLLPQQSAQNNSIGNIPTEGLVPGDSPIINQQGHKPSIGDYGVLSAQNAGNIYNTIQGLRGSENVNLGRMNPDLVDYSAAENATRNQFQSAASVGRENIRRNATSSGQALSNLIAQNTSLSSKKADALANIREQQQNTNVGIKNQAQLTNLGIATQEEQMNTQGQAAAQQALSSGLSGIGSSIAGFNKDNKAYQAQDRAMFEYMQTNNYTWGKDAKGNPIMINKATGLPVNKTN